MAVFCILAVSLSPNPLKLTSNSEGIRVPIEFHLNVLGSKKVCFFSEKAKIATQAEMNQIRRFSACLQVPNSFLPWTFFCSCVEKHKNYFIVGSKMVSLSAVNGQLNH